jgi:transposase-like protein
VVLAFDELHASSLTPAHGGVTCPDCSADMREESGGRVVRRPSDGLRHRCTRCGAAWERNSAGWLFPLSAA